MSKIWKRITCLSRRGEKRETRRYVIGIREERRKEEHRGRKIGGGDAGRIQTE